MIRRRSTVRLGLRRAFMLEPIWNTRALMAWSHPQSGAHRSNSGVTCAGRYVVQRQSLLIGSVCLPVRVAALSGSADTHEMARLS